MPLSPNPPESPPSACAGVPGYAHPKACAGMSEGEQVSLHVRRQPRTQIQAVALLCTAGTLACPKVRSRALGTEAAGHQRRRRASGDAAVRSEVHTGTAAPVTSQTEQLRAAVTVAGRSPKPSPRAMLSSRGTASWCGSSSVNFCSSACCLNTCRALRSNDADWGALLSSSASGPACCPAVACTGSMNQRVSTRATCEMNNVFR